MWPELVNVLSWWQWLILAAVPPAIIALYFLKLKRQPLEVPSTYLWHRSIEDLHVNSIWQRLRRNLLLFLQLLVVGLIIAAVLQPGWRSQKLPGSRFVFLIDNSASMQATDVPPSRLEEAKKQALQAIELMQPGDVGMVLSFHDSADVQQGFTDNRRQLRRAVEAIGPSQRSTSLLEALKVASGLANPGRLGTDDSDVQVAAALPATLFIYSDGQFPDVAGFSLGNLAPVYQPIGSSEANNVGIVAMNVRRHETKPDQLQVFCRLENFGPESARASAKLFLDDREIDAAKCEIAPGEAHGLVFNLGLLDAGVLHLQVTTEDHLSLDDAAWIAVNPPRRAKVLLVTPGNRDLERNMDTAATRELAEVTVEPPAFLDNDKYKQQAAAGGYHLVIYDRCSPKEMPQANTFFLGALPPGDGWKAGPKTPLPHVIDVDPVHPLTQWIEMGDVEIAEATPLEPPPGRRVLIDSHRGPLLAVAPRQRFEDAVLGFVLVDERPGPDGKPARYYGTTWPIKASFPVFMLNLLSYLGGGRTTIEQETLHPGQQIVIESPDPQKSLTVRGPAGTETVLKEAKQGRYVFTETATTGTYQVLLEGQAVQRFAVNLFSPAESAIRPRAEIKIGRTDVEGQAAPEPTRREAWKLLLTMGLVVLMLEWYIYNRRVYL